MEKLSNRQEELLDKVTEGFFLPAVSTAPDPVDWGAELQVVFVDEKMQDRWRAELKLVQQVLRALMVEDFLFCKECGEEIPYQRLYHWPSLLCRGCAEVTERLSSRYNKCVDGNQNISRRYHVSRG